MNSARIILSASALLSVFGFSAPRASAQSAPEVAATPAASIDRNKPFSVLCEERSALPVATRFAFLQFENVDASIAYVETGRGEAVPYRTNVEVDHTVLDGAFAHDQYSMSLPDGSELQLTLNLTDGRNSGSARFVAGGESVAIKLECQASQK